MYYKNKGGAEMTNAKLYKIMMDEAEGKISCARYDMSTRGEFQIYWGALKTLVSLAETIWGIGSDQFYSFQKKVDELEALEKQIF